MHLFSRIAGIFSAPDIAIDMGTANTRVFAAGSGIIADIPSVIRIINQKCVNNLDPANKNCFNQSGEFVKPLEDGVIKNLPAATMLLKKLLKAARRFDFAPQKVLICAPSDATIYERYDVYDAARGAGATEVAVVQEPLAAAVGAGLDISSRYSQLLVDIGAGVTDIAVICDGRIIQSNAVRIAGNHLQRVIQDMITEHFGVDLLENEAELLIRKLGAVNDKPVLDYMMSFGINRNGQGVSINVSSRQVNEAIVPVIKMIANNISRAIKEMTLGVYVEVIETGICLTGGMAELPGMTDFIASETNLPIQKAPVPINCVINGASRMLETAAKTNLWSFS